MKSNKYQITGIKGRLLFLCFVTCYLLIALLSACEDGYQPTVKGIKFCYEDVVRDDDGDPILNDDDEEIPIFIEIDEEHPFTVTNAVRELFIICEIPSKIKEVSLELTYDKGKLDINPVFPYSTDEEHYIPSDNGMTFKGLDPKNLFIFEVKTSTATTGNYPISVTVEPGGVTARCEHIKKE